MVEPFEDVWSGGTRKIGNGPGYIIISPSGTVLFFREGFELLPEKLTVAGRSKGVKKRLATTVADLHYLENDINAAPGVRKVVERIAAILSHQSDETALRMIDELVADLKAARKTRRSNRKAIWPHDSFRVAVQHLYKKLGRVPFKYEVADLLEITQSHNAKLCKANGFSWLPNGLPGRSLK